MEPEPPFFAWSRSRPILNGAPGPRTSGAGAAQKSGGSATLVAAILLVAATNFRRLHFVHFLVMPVPGTIAKVCTGTKYLTKSLILI